MRAAWPPHVPTLPLLATSADTSIAWLTYVLYTRGALAPGALPSLLAGDAANPLALALGITPCAGSAGAGPHGSEL